MEIISKLAKDLSDPEIDQINALTEATWPHTKAENTTKDIQRSNFIDSNPEKTSILGLVNDRIVAYAEVFPRAITIDGAAQLIMGLAAVCVDQSLRGQGYGKDMTLAAFEFVNRREYEVSLFQTGVPEFYNKLTCKEIKNQVVNSHNKAAPTKNPFWDNHIMIYPKDFQINKGPIDLLGCGY
ncbi:MAG: putative N-acetyltransferase YhbS [Roseivirga sp.]|jgi:predicted N-acetyltransferase YhbS